MNVSTALTPISATHLNSSSSASAQLVLTFNDDILTGAGAITISDGATQTYIGKDGTLRTRLIGATDTRTIDITDTSKVSISGNTVTITLDSNLSAGKHYSVQMAQGVLLDENGNPFAGLADTSKLPFAVAAKPVPAAVIDSALAFQDDTGSSATDFITKSALQGVSGKFSGVLASGDFIEVSLDNGGTWLMATVDKDSWHVEASLTGSSTIVARVSNAEGGHSTAVRQAYTFDNQAPAVESITLSDADFVAGETAVVTLTFTETVTGLDLADFAVSGGVLSNLVNTGDGKTWTATLTPTINVANGVGQIALLADGVADVAGNSGPASAAQVSFTYSTVPNAPAAIVTSASMTDSGASSSDFITNATTQTITGQYAGTLAADEYIEVSLDGGTTYVRATASAGNWSIPSTTISASDTLKARVTNGYTYSNPLVEAYTLDQAAPTVGVTVADSTLALGETSLVTFTFNEAVANFSNQDITVSGGTLSPVSSADGGTTWTATFTPSTATLASTNAITVNKTGLTDLAGNAGAGNTSSANYVVDTVRPTVSGISVADTALTAGETTTVTFTFSEAVTGLSMADITVANGTLSALASSDGGLTWTATLTPASAVEDTSNLITLDHAGFADSAGNAGSGSTSSANYTVDTKRPTATISMADATLTAGETTSVTITFSEAVTGLTSADFTLGNGTLSTPTTADNGVTWNATFTPSASVDATSNIIVLNNAGVADTVGNAGSGTTSSGNYIVATTRPSASAITVADTALKAGETTTVTITFAEAVNGLTAADFSVANGTLSEPVSSDNGLTWTATLTPASAIEDTTNLITLDNTGVTDSDGNAGSGSTSSANYTVDTVRPLTSSISLADSTLSAGETTVVTFAFSEAVTGLTAAAVTVANGALSTPVSSDGGLTWTATLTPTASVDDSSNLLTLDNSAITDSAGNAGTVTTSSANYTVATVRPTATINVADDKLTAGETATVTITFSEAVSGLTSDDFTVGKGSLSTPTTSDNGVTWTATFTPPVNFDDEANVIVLDNTGVTDASGNTGSGTTSSNFHMLATRRPTVESLTVSDTALKVGDTATVTITFSEAVSGLTAADFSVANGTLSEPVSSNNGLTWTATLTPTAAIEDTSNLITLDNTGVTDRDGNAGSGSTSSANYTVDTVRPLTSSISLADSTLSAGETTTVTFTFSEAVTDLTAADVTVANGALSAPVSSDGGLTWTATLTPTASVEDSSNVITLDNTGIADAAGNAGSGTTSSANYTLDTKRPTATISVADTKLTAGETTTVTITFSEAVSGLSSDDISVDEGTLSTPTTSDNGVTWTATLTPQANADTEATTIVLDNTGVTDAAGNTGSGTTSSGNYMVATRRPTVESITVSDSTLKIGATATVTITFSEAVQGLTETDFSVANGTLSELFSSDGGLTWTATLLPASAIEDSTNIITLNHAGVTDHDGNAGSGSTSSANYTVDTVRPLTSSISLADNMLTAGETTTVTFTFSEAITDLTAADVTIANGTLSAPVSSDGGLTWTATLTPTASVDDSSNVITLDNTGIADAAGNAGSGTTSSANYTVATVRPTATISMADAKLTAGETTTVTITFSEAVSGLTSADLTVGNGTLSTPTTSDNGVTWNATFTPSASVDATSNVIVLNNTGVTDASGNTGSGTTSSANYAVATTRPTVALAVSDTALKVGETATVTIAFFEPVSGLTLDDFTVDNGTLSNLVVIGEGLTYTATLTPTSNIEDTSNSVVLNNTGITDSDGNTGAGTTSSDNYAIDTKAPTATITLSDDTLGLGETSTVTITFHESVVDFSNDDITVNGGTLGTLTTSDSITWTATLTPLTTGSGSGSITLASGSLVDIVFNSGPTTATSTSFSYAVPPTITIASVALSADTGTSGDFITNTASQTISGTLSAALSGGEFVEVSLDGGSNWTSVSSVSGTSWSLSGQTLSGDNTLMARVSNSSASGTALSHAYQLDQSAPSATITLSEAALLTGETAIVTITFSEAVSGLTLADLKSSGTLTNLASNSDGTVWTATLSATSGGEVRLDPSSVIDIAGNSGPATSIYANYTYNAAPTATIASVSMTDPYNSGDFITSSASQVISGTLSAALGRGQFVEVSLDNGATWSQATISNGTNWSLSGQTISASNTLKVRASNGTTTGTEYSHSYTLDQTDPTLSSVTLSSSALLTNQTATVTVVFDEAVYDLTKDDFVVSGGTLGTFTTTDQLTWTGTLTPTASGNIVLSPANVTDRAGNVGNAANSKIAVFTFTADTTGPSATLTLSDNTLAKGGTATLTVTLSEAVADTPVASDFTVAGGTLGTFSSADNGLTWTATLTPTNGAYGEGYVLLKSNTINDPAGNPGPSSSASLPFIYDTQTLTLSSTMALSSDSGSSASDFITNTGTQTISGAFSGGSIYANMGGKIEVSTDNGSTWNNATVDNGTHTWSISASLSGSNTIQVRLTDGTGIAGTAVTQTYTIDSTAPEYLSSGLLDLSTSSDTGNGLSGSTTDNVTTDTTPTVTYSLYNTGMLAGDYVDIIDISTNTTLASHLITSSDLASYGNTITTELGPLSSGNHYLQLRGRDVAGNVGTLGEGRLPLTIDTSTASMENKTVTLHTDSDSGSSHRDNITNDNTPTVTVNVANTANLSAGDELQIIDSSNADAVVGTYRLTSSDFNSEGEDISITTSSLADGNHALKLRVYDKAGNYGTAGIATTITIDTIAPTLTSSTPSSSSGSNSINTSAITLGFSEALAEVNSRTGFKISNGAGDVREITGELTSGDMLSYDAGTHTFTLALSGSLQYDSSYDVTVYNQVLTDAAGNSREIDTLLLTFSTESSSTPDPDPIPDPDPTPDPNPIPPSGVTLSLSDTTYASYVGTEDDHITSNNILTVSGITATFLQYKLSSDDLTWTTVMPSSGTYELTLGDGTYGTSELQFRQFNDTGYESDITTLNNAWTIDTQGPILWIERADEFLGQGNASQIALSVGWSGEINPDDTIIEYSTDGTTWTKASSTTSLRAQLTGVNIAAGGELQVRATDKAGNAGTHNNATYIAYFGDSTAATHTAAGGKYLFLQGADDIVDISGNSNVVYTSYGANTVHINASSNNTVVGGNGIDTITLTGASSNNHLFPYEGNDIITLGANVTSTFIGTGDGNDTIAISSTNNINTLDGGAGVDTLQFNAAGSLAALVGQVTNIEKLYVAATSQLTIGNTVSQANLTAMGFGTVTVQLTQYALVRLEGDSGALLASGSHYAFSDSSSALVQALGSELTSGHNIYVNTDANIILLVGTNVSLGSS